MALLGVLVSPYYFTFGIEMPASPRYQAAPPVLDAKQAQDAWSVRLRNITFLFVDYFTTLYQLSFE
jgi:hypothetical protein